MATTTLLRIKSAGTKSISHILKDRTEYIENNKKTNNKYLVYSYNCTPETAYLDFTASKILYNEFKGNETKKQDDVLAYHIRQAFSPDDNITPEKAHEIGKKLADQFTKGNHEYVIATHVDKKHIHNHIIFNSTTIDCTRKFNNFYKSTYALRKISDKLCEQYSLSVVTPKTERGQHYKEWQEDKKGESWKSKLKRNIDKCIECSPDFDQFKNNMQNLGYEIKEGKHIAFRANGQERFTRAKTLGDMYTEQSIIKRIAERSMPEDKCITTKKMKNKLIGDVTRVKKVPITLENRVMINVRKQHIKDVKELANTLLLLRQESINKKSDFESRIEELRSRISRIKVDIKRLDDKVSEYREIAKYLATTSRNKDVYYRYEKCNPFNKKGFYSKHEGDILSYEYAAKKLSEMNIDIATPFDKVICKANEFINKAQELKKGLHAIENRIKDIRVARKKVDHFLNADTFKTLKIQQLREQRYNI
ncbi:MAG: relaxase/mobilization nuclease domain-containing protein [Clostridiaceae bacterium]|nr:relaxase/mobilization nuclease domain-containing protein [Clostridiaceae bacterium]